MLTLNAVIIKNHKHCKCIKICVLLPLHVIGCTQLNKIVFCVLFCQEQGFQIQLEVVSLSNLKDNLDLRHLKY